PDCSNCCSGSCPFLPPGTRLLFGATNDFDFGAASGVRITAGCWLDCTGTCGIEARGFVLEQLSHRQNFHTDIGVNTPAACGLACDSCGSAACCPAVCCPVCPVLSPDVVFVASNVARTQLYGAEANFLTKLCCCDCWNIDAFAGFRWLSLNESLTLASAT